MLRITRSLGTTPAPLDSHQEPAWDRGGGRGRRSRSRASSEPASRSAIYLPENTGSRRCIIAAAPSIASALRARAACVCDSASKAARSPSAR